jgi:hypothetical protein
MNRSESIKNLAPALLKVQREMGDAKKGASNPFFKSSYADLNSVRETALPVLNANGITCLQPTVEVNMKNFVETVLIHETGEWLSSLTEIKNTDGKAQSEGSGISYARRYGLQSLLNIGAVDDDAEGTMGRVKTFKAEPKTTNTTVAQGSNATFTANPPVAKKGPGRPAKAPQVDAKPTAVVNPALAKEYKAEVSADRFAPQPVPVTKLPTKVANGYSGNGTSNKIITNSDEW